MKKRRVVVTGMGVISTLGCGIQRSWQNLIAGSSGIRSLSALDSFDFSCKIGGYVPEGNNPEELNISEWIDPKEQRRMDWFISLAVVAAEMARLSFKLGNETCEDEEDFFLGTLHERASS